MRSRSHRPPLSRQAGFSLPELMVVLAIIMLLITLAVPRMRGAKQRAQEAAAVATMKGVHTAQEAHRITHGSYAPDFKVLAGQGGVPVVPPDAETQEGGGSGESVMAHQGYIYRLNRTAPDEYTLTAEPVENRDTRPRYTMDHIGTVVGTGGTQAVGGGGVSPPPDEPPADNPPDEPPPGGGP